MDEVIVFATSSKWWNLDLNTTEKALINWN
jgi:hypothetical protein